MVSLQYANEPTPTTGAIWRGMTNVERIAKVMTALGAYNGDIQVVAARPNGQVILEMMQSRPAGLRGVLLMGFEKRLKEVDAGITVWLEPKGDKNALRLQLRGIEVKA